MDDASGRFFCFGDGDRGVETVQLLPQMVCVNSFMPSAC